MKVDVWFLAKGTYYSVQAAQERIRQQLTPGTQGAILAIKTIWADSPNYRRIVTSMDIYDAVLRHEVMTPERVEAYLERKRQ